MSVIVTGGAGFIGSCVVKALNDSGIVDIIVVDNVGKSEKWRNLVGKRYLEYVHKSDFLTRLNSLEGVTHIVHLGACSSTTETDFDYLWENNVQFGKHLFAYCAEKKISFIYASSAATYGNGKDGFSDELPPEKLMPLNRYGYSKNLFDEWVKKQADRPKQTVGLKFFNVYGPNEYHKGGMASMVFHGFHQISESGEIRLFSSSNEEMTDGEQKRDFVYVKDVCKVLLWLMKNEAVNGVFNVGTGNAGSFNALAKAIFRALGKTENIKYIPMPATLVKQYQNYTVADMKKLRAAGYTEPFRSLEEGVNEYVTVYLKEGKYE